MGQANRNEEQTFVPTLEDEFRKFVPTLED